MSGCGRKSLQKCARCRNHGVHVLKRGHKRFCPWSSCMCETCMLTSLRQNIMAKQVALSRQQKEDSELGITAPPPVTDRNNPDTQYMEDDFRIGLQTLAQTFMDESLPGLYAILRLCRKDVSLAIKTLLDAKEKIQLMQDRSGPLIPQTTKAPGGPRIITPKPADQQHSYRQITIPRTESNSGIQLPSLQPRNIPSSNSFSDISNLINPPDYQRHPLASVTLPLAQNYMPIAVAPGPRTEIPIPRKDYILRDNARNNGDYSPG